MAVRVIVGLQPLLEITNLLLLQGYFATFRECGRPKTVISE
jgi:hypothetical protein